MICKQLRIVLFFWTVAFGAITNSASKSDATPLIGWGVMGTVGVCSLNAVTARALFSPSFFPDKLYALGPLAVSLATYNATQEIYKQKNSQKQFVYNPLLYTVPSLAAIGGAAAISWLWHGGSSAPLYVGAATVASIPAMLRARKYIKQEREINDIRSMIMLENEDIFEYVKRTASFYQTTSCPLRIPDACTNFDQIITLLEHNLRLREKLVKEEFSCTFKKGIVPNFHGEDRIAEFRQNNTLIDTNTIQDIFSEESRGYGYALQKLFMSIDSAIQEVVQKEADLLVENCSDASRECGFEVFRPDIYFNTSDCGRSAYYTFHNWHAANMLQMKFIAKVLHLLPQLVVSDKNNNKIEQILNHMPKEYAKDEAFYHFRDCFFKEAIKTENFDIILMAGHRWFLNEPNEAHIAIENIFKQVILNPESTLSARERALNFYRSEKDLTYSDDLKNIIKAQIKKCFPIAQEDDFLNHWENIKHYCNRFRLPFEDEYLLKPLPNSCDTALHLGIKIDHEPLIEHISSDRDFSRRLLLTPGDDGKIPLEILFSDVNKYWKIINFLRPAIREIWEKHQTDRGSFDQEISPIVTKTIEDFNKQLKPSDLF